MINQHTKTEQDDIYLEIEDQNPVVNVSISGKWHSDGKCPIFLTAAEYAETHREIVKQINMNLSDLDYNWWDGFIRPLITAFW